jgi:hypothetical protein
MRNRSRATLVAAIAGLSLMLGGLLVAPESQAAEKPPTISKKVMKPLKAGLDLTNQGKYPEAEAELRTADGDRGQDAL